MNVLHHVLAGGLEVGDEGNAVGDGLPVIEGEGDTDGVRHGDEVEHTALVEPPSAMTMVMAFSDAAQVMMSRGLRSISRRV